MKILIKQTHKHFRWLLPLSCFLLIAACSSSKRPATIDASSGSQENWFCQTGLEQEAWDCIQDESLAKNPSPTRSPPARSPGTEGRALPSPELPASIQTPIAPRQAIPSTPSTRSDETAAKPVRNQLTRAEPATSQSSPTQNETNLPDYIRLAYQPEKAVRMLDVPGEYWAVQLMALSSKESLESFAKNRNIRGMSAARIAIDDKLFYILLLGIYESRTVAEEVTVGLPPPFDKPWVRSVASLQAGMRKANELTGATRP